MVHCSRQEPAKAAIFDEKLKRSVVGPAIPWRHPRERQAKDYKDPTCGQSVFMESSGKVDVHNLIMLSIVTSLCASRNGHSTTSTCNGYQISPRRAVTQKPTRGVCKSRSVHLQADDYVKRKLMESTSLRITTLYSFY